MNHILSSILLTGLLHSPTHTCCCFLFLSTQVYTLWANSERARAGDLRPPFIPTACSTDPRDSYTHRLLSKQVGQSHPDRRQRVAPPAFSSQILRSKHALSESYTCISCPVHGQKSGHAGQYTRQRATAMPFLGLQRQLTYMHSSCSCILCKGDLSTASCLAMQPSSSTQRRCRLPTRAQVTSSTTGATTHCIASLPS